MLRLSDKPEAPKLNGCSTLCSHVPTLPRALNTTNVHVTDHLEEREATMLKKILTPLLTSSFDDPRSLHQPSNNVPGADDSSAEDFTYDVRVEIIRRTVEQLKSTSNITAHREVS